MPYSKHHKSLSQRLLPLFTLCLCLLTLSGCNLAGVLVTPSATPDVPTAEFVAPPNQATIIEGAELPIDVVGRDALSGIAHLEVRVDGVTLKDITPPDNIPVPVFRATTNWLAKGVGLHVLSVIAYRTDGAASDETVISIQVLPAQ